MGCVVNTGSLATREAKMICAHPKAAQKKINRYRYAGGTKWRKVRATYCQMCDQILDEEDNGQTQTVPYRGRRHDRHDQRHPFPSRGLKR